MRIRQGLSICSAGIALAVLLNGCAPGTSAPADPDALAESVAPEPGAATAVREQSVLPISSGEAETPGLSASGQGSNASREAVVDRYSLIKNGNFAERDESHSLPLHWTLGATLPAHDVTSTIHPVEVPESSFSHPLEQTWPGTDSAHGITDAFGQTVTGLTADTEYELRVVAHNQSKNTVIISAYEVEGYDAENPAYGKDDSRQLLDALTIPPGESATEFTGIFRTKSDNVVRLAARIQQEEPAVPSTVVWYKWELRAVTGRKSNLVPNGAFAAWPAGQATPSRWSMEAPHNLNFEIERLTGPEYVCGNAMKLTWKKPQGVHRSRCLATTLMDLAAGKTYAVELIVRNPSKNTYRLSAWELTGGETPDSITLGERLSYAVLNISPNSPGAHRAEGAFTPKQSGAIRLILSCEEDEENRDFPADLVLEEWRVYEAPTENDAEQSKQQTQEASQRFAPRRAAARKDSAGPRPNVVWVLFDALRARNLSAYGYSRETSPNIASFAQEGVLFEQNFSQGFWTRVSMSSLVTGRYFGSVIDSYPRQMDTFKPRGDGEELISETLRANGYHTVLFTAHAAFPPRSLFSSSFDECIYLRSPEAIKTGYDRFEVVNAAIAKYLEDPPEQPLFFFVHTLDTHFPHHLETPYDRWIDPEYESPQISAALGMPAASEGLSFTTEDQHCLTGLYDGGIAYADHQFGELLKLLREKELLSNSVVIVSSDHGDLLAEDGTTWGHPEATYDLLMNVPLVISGPGLPKGIRVSALTENADVVPTLIDLLALDTQSTCDGVSLRPLWENPSGERPHRYVFSKLHGINDTDPVYVLRDSEYKLEYDPKHGVERLWKLPEDGQIRQDVAVSQGDVLKIMKDYVHASLVPLWEAYASRPDAAIRFRVSENLDKLADKDAVFVPEEGQPLSPDWHRDGKWLLYEDKLWTALWMEKVPPLRFSLPVPNGDYLVQIRLLAREDLDGHPASKIKVLIQNDSEYKYIRETKPVKNRPLLYGEAGMYTITDGTLRVRVEASNATDWAIFDEIRLVPATWYAKESDSEIEEQSEQLKALGYL